MIRTTPFHERLTELNDQHLYTHWQGFLSALRYSHAPKHEYFAVRGGVGIFDTSPLLKYRITGPRSFSKPAFTRCRRGNRVPRRSARGRPELARPVGRPPWGADAEVAVTWSSYYRDGVATWQLADVG